MKAKTKRLIGIVAVAGTVLAAGTAVFAHGGPGSGWGGGPGWGGHHRMMPGMMGGPGWMHGGGGPGWMHGNGGGPGAMMGGNPMNYSGEQLANIKGALGITADQEAVWNGYQEAARNAAQLMSSHYQRMHGGRAGVDTQEHLNMMQEGVQQMQELATATQDLYAALTPQQKTTADQWIGSGVGRPCGAAR